MTDEFYSHAFVDPETGVAVVSDLDPAEFEGYDFGGLTGNDGIRRALASWAEDARSLERPSPIFSRDKFKVPNTIFDVLEAAASSVDDDILSNVLDTSESFAFHRISMEHDDAEQEDVWNQIAADLDLDSFMRQVWRELFIYSQVYVVGLWEWKTYRVRGETESGNKKRKSFRVYVPSSLATLDPLRVVPVKRNILGGQRYAWVLGKDEFQRYEEDEFRDGYAELFEGIYEPKGKEKAELEKHDVPTDRLVLFREGVVWGHTLTKSSYERWATVRLKSLFPLLDIKNLVREMDRVWLKGGINFIVLVKRGTDNAPAKRAEVDQTATQMRSQSKAPTIVSDHRIDIEIITPDISGVVNEGKWATLDQRIIQRAWGMFAPPSSMFREDSGKLAQVVARGLTSRRHMLRRAVEKHLIRAVVEHGLNGKSGLEAAKLQFNPRRMDLESDPALINMMMSMWENGNMSRETLLAEFNFDQDTEAVRRRREKLLYDGDFDPPEVPYSAKSGEPPGASGRRGKGRPPGSEDSDPVQKEQETNEQA